MEAFWLNLMGVLIAVTLTLAILTGIIATWRRIQKKDTHVLMKWLSRFTIAITMITIIVSLIAFYLNYLS